MLLTLDFIRSVECSISKQQTIPIYIIIYCNVLHIIMSMGCFIDLRIYGHWLPPPPWIELPKHIHVQINIIAFFLLIKISEQPTHFNDIDVHKSTENHAKSMTAYKLEKKRKQWKFDGTPCCVLRSIGKKESITVNKQNINSGGILSLGKNK
jgi:hypothetical protein